MSHLPHFITDLALILVTAGIAMLLFRKIKQPVVLGYILAGVLVGPHVSLFPTVVDSEAVRVWSDIGVIFLLFSLGLEFSFKKLLNVGGAALITSLIQIVLMNSIGYLTGRLLGWTFINSLFLGAILSISSTTIIVRAFDELGLRTQKFAKLVFGVLIVQDLVAVLLLVLLSTFAITRQFTGFDLLTEASKLVFFLTLWFLAGIFFIPTFLRRARSLLNDESMLIVSIALCLLMVVLAVEVGFSAALGAFIMGSILAETSQAERIEHLVKSVKTLFAAIFFVSVGMMIDPLVLKDHALVILMLSVIVVVGMTTTTILGALLSGQTLKHSVQAGMSLAQIGEFSFIIAALGVSLNVTQTSLYPIAITVSAITSFTTPFLIRRADSFYKYVERMLPARVVQSLNRYSVSSQQLSANSDWKELLRGYFANTIIHSVIIGAVIYLSHYFIQPFFSGMFENPDTGKITSTAVTLLIMIPFIWALTIRRIKRKEYSHLWLNKKLNRGPLIVIEISRIVIAVFLVGILINLYFSVSVAFLTAIIFLAIATIVFNQKLQAFYDRLENQFLSNLNDRKVHNVVRQQIVPWDAHLANFEVQSEFKHIGKHLEQLRLRETYGVNIASIERGKLFIVTPDRYERLYPGDKLSIIGTDDQLALLKEYFEGPDNDSATQSPPNDEIVLQNFTVTRSSRLYNQTIRASRIREEAQGLIVGMERNGQRILNPESTERFQEGDIIWIVGVRKKIETFLGITQ